MPTLVTHVSRLDQDAVLHFPLEAQAVFHVARHFQMRVDGSHSGSGWSRCAHRACASVKRRQLTIRRGHLNDPRRLTLQADPTQCVGLWLVVEDSKPAANDGLVAKRRIGKADARNEDVFRFVETTWCRCGDGRQERWILGGKRHSEGLVAGYVARAHQSVAADQDRNVIGKNAARADTGAASHWTAAWVEVPFSVNKGRVSQVVGRRIKVTHVVALEVGRIRTPKANAQLDAKFMGHLPTVLSISLNYIETVKADRIARYLRESLEVPHQCVGEGVTRGVQIPIRAEHEATVV